MKATSYVLLLISLFISISNAFSTNGNSIFHDPNHTHPAGNLDFIPNLNQFEEPVLFRAGLGGLNKIFLEEKGFTYLFHAEKEMLELHDVRMLPEVERLKHFVPAHAYKVRFLGAQTPKITGSDKKSHHLNYFLGQ